MRFKTKGSARQIAGRLVDPVHLESPAQKMPAASLVGVRRRFAGLHSVMMDVRMAMSVGLTAGAHVLHVLLVLAVKRTLTARAATVALASAPHRVASIRDRTETNVTSTAVELVIAARLKRAASEMKTARAADVSVVSV